MWSLYGTRGLALIALVVAAVDASHHQLDQVKVGVQVDALPGVLLLLLRESNGIEAPDVLIFCIREAQILWETRRQG